MKSRPGLVVPLVGRKRRGHRDRPSHVTGQIQPQDFKMAGPCNRGPTDSPRGSGYVGAAASALL